MGIGCRLKTGFFDIRADFRGRKKFGRTDSSRKVQGRKIWERLEYGLQPLCCLPRANSDIAGYADRG